MADRSLVFMPFIISKTTLPDVLQIEAKVFPDSRGFFSEHFKMSEFEKNGVTAHFAQDNFSVSRKGVVRGLHFQKNPDAQGKLVSVVKGKIWDVAVDIRKSSPTFKQWVGVELSDENRMQLYIPEGFAHGFVALEEDTRVLYKTTREYSAAADSGIVYNDPDLGIPWPVENPIVSEKDLQLPLLANAELFE